MSSFEHSRTNVSAAIRNLNAGAPRFQVQKVNQINDRFARIVGTISAKASPEQLLSAVRGLVKHAAPVQGSFRALANNGYTMSVEGIVGTIEERIVLSDENRGNFQAVAANMYMDEEETLWSMRSSELGEVLIKSHAHDDMSVMSELMACVASTQVGVQEAEPSSAKEAQIRNTVEGGDLAAYVSLATGTLQMGYVVVTASSETTGEDMGLVVQANNSEKTELIPRDLVVDFVKAEHLDYDEAGELEAVASGEINMERIAAYYRKMFMRRPEYFEKFWERFKSHKFA